MMAVRVDHSRAREKLRWIVAVVSGARGRWVCSFRRSSAETSGLDRPRAACVSDRGPEGLWRPVRRWLGQGARAFMGAEDGSETGPRVGLGRQATARKASSVSRRSGGHERDLDARV